MFLKDIYIKFNKVGKFFIHCHSSEEESHILGVEKKPNALATKDVG